MLRMWTSGWWIQRTVTAVVPFSFQPPRDLRSQEERVHGGTAEERRRDEANVCSESQGEGGWTQGGRERGTGPAVAVLAPASPRSLPTRRNFVFLLAPVAAWEIWPLEEASPGREKEAGGEEEVARRRAQHVQTEKDCRRALAEPSTASRGLHHAQEGQGEEKVSIVLFLLCLPTICFKSRLRRSLVVSGSGKSVDSATLARTEEQGSVLHFAQSSASSREAELI